MLGQQDLYQLIGVTAYDRDGERLGTVETVFVDTQTDDATFAAVKTGLFGSRSSMVPLTHAEVRDGDLHVAQPADRVKDAPSVDADDRLDPAQELELYRYYDIPAVTEAGEGGAVRDRGEGADTQPDTHMPTGADLIADQGIDPMFDGPQVDPEARLRLRRIGDPVAHADESRAQRGDAGTDEQDRS